MDFLLPTISAILSTKLLPEILETPSTEHAILRTIVAITFS